MVLGRALVGGGAWQLFVAIWALGFGLVRLRKGSVVVGLVVVLLALPLGVSGGYFLKSAYDQWESRQGQVGEGTGLGWGCHSFSALFGVGFRVSVVDALPDRSAAGVGVSRLLRDDGRSNRP